MTYAFEEITEVAKQMEAGEIKDAVQRIYTKVSTNLARASAKTDWATTLELCNALLICCGDDADAADQAIAKVEDMEFGVNELISTVFAFARYTDELRYTEHFIRLMQVVASKTPTLKKLDEAFTSAMAATAVNIRANIAGATDVIVGEPADLCAAYDSVFTAPTVDCGILAREDAFSKIKDIIMATKKNYLHVMYPALRAVIRRYADYLHASTADEEIMVATNLLRDAGISGTEAAIILRPFMEGAHD